MCIHGRDRYLLKPTLGSPREFKHLTRVDEVVMTRLRIGHTKAAKSHILSRAPPTACQHCGLTLIIEHILLEGTVLQQIRDEYYTSESLRALFETIPEACIVEIPRAAGFFYLIWKAIYSIQQIIKINDQLTKFGSHINRHTLTTPLHSVIRLRSINNWENPTCERRLICLWGRVSSLNKCNPIQSKSHILSRGPPTACHHCGQILSIDHMLMKCAVLQECLDEYYIADSLNTLFETIPETCIVGFIQEAGFFYLIWMVKYPIQFITWTTVVWWNLLTSTSPQTCTIR